jgi:hypothetical protein
VLIDLTGPLGACSDPSIMPAGDHAVALEETKMRGEFITEALIFV